MEIPRSARNDNNDGGDKRKKLRFAAQIII